MSILSKKYFHNEKAAFAFLESVIWPNGPVCPHCGGIDRITKVKPNVAKRVRLGLHRCGDCKKQFTVKVGTVFEHARIPLHKMLQAVYLMVSSKKGISAHQLHRTLEITYKSAWFLTHRIREAMREGKLGPLGGENKVVEVDETYIGGKAKNRAFREPPKKEAVVSLVEREGKVHSVHIANVTAKPLRPTIVQIASRKSYLMTDEARVYKGVGKEFAGHASVNHSIDKYVRGVFWHTNTIENYFSIMKRGINGVYQQVSEAQLKRYLGEFDFRYNTRGVTDSERHVLALEGIVGKRLTYGGPRPSHP